MTDHHGTSFVEAAASWFVAVCLWFAPIWVRIVSDVHDSLPTVLQILGVAVAVSTIWRNVIAIRRGEP